MPVETLTMFVMNCSATLVKICYLCLSPADAPPGPLFNFPYHLIALGAALRWKNFLDDSLISGMNKLAFWIGLPCLLMLNISQVNRELDVAGFKVIMAVLIATTVITVIAWGVAVIFRLPGEKAGPFIHGTFCGNFAYIGLAIVNLVFYAENEHAGKIAMDTACIVIAPMVAFYSILAVLVLLISKHALSRQALKKIMIKLITNPLLLACIVGILWNSFSWPILGIVKKTLSTIAQFALPVALLSIGGAMMQTRVKKILRNPAILAAIIKTVICPLVGYFLCRYFGLGDIKTIVVLVFLAVPTALYSYTMADQLDCDSLIAAEIIVISTFMSVVSLSVVLSMVSSIQ